MQIEFNTEQFKEFPAPLGKRFLAFLIDILLFYFFIYSTSASIFLYAMGLKNVDMSVIENEEITGALEFLFYLNTMFFFVYKSFYEYRFGMTFGKKLMNIYVKTDSLRGSFVRNLFVFFPLLLLIDLIPLVYSNQRFLEKLSNTQVLYEPSFVIDLGRDML